MAKSKPRVNNTRAARRAASPVDKSLVAAPRAESPAAERPSVLAERRSSGIQKRQAQKKMSRSQRLRQQKGMDRAEAVSDQLQIKKAKSIVRGKAVRARSGEWEELNKKASKSAFAALQQDDEDDEDDNDSMAEDTAPTKSKPNPFAASHEADMVEDPATVDEDDQIT
ncbi:hypothetical protein N7466_009907 [Penicillium verhagenii]|uniref:uncharacterized protein n=1 Tax=Penicillium verhagenii TaxID=1562060 RepID=UPI002544DAB1|nr:uncharacterized protein N7466_009907 [Penicillium verhagenii]KAJ5918964.1 hypothetical protein N7466_009907 [Penicillium verhagenii]